MEKIISISLKLNFTPNTLGCYVLMWHYLKLGYLLGQHNGITEPCPRSSMKDSILRVSFFICAPLIHYEY